MITDQLTTPVGFQFKVMFSASKGAFDSSFQDVNGIDVSMKTTSYKEGGENRYAHKLPEAIDHPNLTLIRGITLRTSPLVKWCKSVLEGDFSMPIQTMPMQVFLLNEKGMPSRIWSFSNAFPVAWKMAAFNATKNEVALETIELSYNTVTREL